MKFRSGVAIIWILFTLSMIAWWWFYGLDHLSTPLSAVEQLRRQRMLFWEGISFFIAQGLGSAGLLYFMKKDELKNQMLRNFFAGFSHDVRTSLTRLRLEADFLLEDEKLVGNKNLNRLVRNVNQLDLQLENSLWMAQVEDFKRVVETFSISKLIAEVKNEFPDLRIELAKDFYIESDYRSLLFVFRNLIQNSVLHGHATILYIKEESPKKISVKDDGVGCKIKPNLDQPLMQMSRNSQSSGMGLYICRQILTKMGGNLKILINKEQHNTSIETQFGFGVLICL